MQDPSCQTGARGTMIYSGQNAPANSGEKTPAPGRSSSMATILAVLQNFYFDGVIKTHCDWPARKTNKAAALDLSKDATILAY